MPAGFPQQTANPFITYSPVAYEFSAAPSQFRDPEMLPAGGTVSPTPPSGGTQMPSAIPIGRFELLSSGGNVSCQKTWPDPIETIAAGTIPASYPATPPEPTTVRNINLVKTIGDYLATLSYFRDGFWRAYQGFSGLFGSQFPVRDTTQSFTSVTMT